MEDPRLNQKLYTIYNYCQTDSRVTRNELFKLLREHNIFYYWEGQNEVYQKYLDEGYFVEVSLINPVKDPRTGETKFVRQIHLTEKGFKWLRKKIGEWTGLKRQTLLWEE